jgi:replicative DNA helicase
MIHPILRRRERDQHRGGATGVVTVAAQLHYQRFVSMAVD